MTGNWRNSSQIFPDPSGENYRLTLLIPSCISYCHTGLLRSGFSSHTLYISRVATALIRIRDSHITSTPPVQPANCFLSRIPPNNLLHSSNGGTMTNPRRQGKLWLLAIFLVSATGLSGQIISSSTVVGTGGSLASSATTTIQATLGQPIIGLSTPSRSLLWQGFWVPTMTAKASANTSISEHASVAARSLRCFPNPVSTSAMVTLQLPTTEEVTLVLHDPLGREVRTLINNEQRSGEVRLTLETEELPSGWYTLILSAGTEQLSLPVRIVQ